MRHALRSLAAAAFAVGFLALPAMPAHANGTVPTFENHPDVRVFAPTPLAYDTDVVEPAPAVPPVNVAVHVYLDALALDWRYHRAVAWAHRKYRIHRAFGHRYTGFIRMYRGPRYPF